MEQKLLLLGILRHADMHAYQLNELLEAHTNAYFPLKKTTAYSILKKMHEDEWIQSYTEQEGNRPPRQVYQLTEEGEAQFLRMLKESLATYNNPSLPGLIAVGLMDALAPAEALTLLQQRRAAMYEQMQIFYDEDHRDSQNPVILYLRRAYTLELDWLDSLIQDLTQQVHPND